MTLRGYQAVVAAGAVLAFSTNLANYGLRFGVEPLAWVAGFVLLSAPLALAAVWSGRLRPEPVAAWSVGYMLLSFVWFFPSSQSAAAWQQVQTRVLSVAFLLLMLFLFADERTQRAARQALVAATLLTAGLNLYELFNPLTFSEIPGRSTGLFANVNQSGSAMVVGLVLGQGAVPPRLRPLYVLATGLGVLPTFSRAAILGWIVVCALTWLLGGVRLKGVLALGAAGAAVAIFLASPWWTDLRLTLEQRGVLTENVRDRLAVLGGGTSGDASTEERLGVAQLAWTTFADRPVTGSGTGATTEGIFELGPHNMYLAMGAEHGIVGMVVVPALVAATVWGGDRVVAPVSLSFAFYVAFWGLFSHNLLEERHLLLGFALVGAMVSSRRWARQRSQEVAA